MKVSLSTIKRQIRSFDQDERGMETLQTVLIIAVAAMILALVVSQWDTISDWVVNAINQVTGEDMTELNNEVESF